MHQKDKTSTGTVTLVTELIKMVAAIVSLVRVFWL